MRNLLLVVAVCVFVSAQAGYGIMLPVESTFSSDLDGWTIENPVIGTLTYQAAGGNPGGFAKFTDLAGGRGLAIAPVKFLGDWSNLNNNAILSFDHKVIDFGQNIDGLPFRVNISGVGGAAYWSSNTAPSANWQTLNATIAEANWTVTSGTWATLLADVSYMAIAIEGIDNTQGNLDIDGMDNVRIRAIPEPATLALLCTGAVALLRRRNAA